MGNAAPQDHRVFREMGFIFLNVKRNIEMARRMFERSLSLNEDQPDLVQIVKDIRYSNITGSDVVSEPKQIQLFSWRLER